MQTNPVGWFEIYVQDMVRAKGFYEAVFGTTLERLNAETPEMWAFPAQPDRWGAGGSLVHMPGFASGGNSTLVYFSCEDCAVQEKRAADLGAHVQQSKMSIGEYGFISLVVDTEGNMLGLHSMQ